MIASAEARMPFAYYRPAGRDQRWSHGGMYTPAGRFHAKEQRPREQGKPQWTPHR